MADINIAFDRRQVAGWEQMLGGRLKKEREANFYTLNMSSLSDLLI